ncbi:MAG: hypothetical protein GY853_01000 [PVC group bacterium]|nr:hypothetical protein [PVC group bacterium]
MRAIEVYEQGHFFVFRFENETISFVLNREILPELHKWIQEDLGLFTPEQCAHLLVKYCMGEVLK